MNRELALKEWRDLIDDCDGALDDSITMEEAYTYIKQALTLPTEEEATELLEALDKTIKHISFIQSNTIVSNESGEDLQTLLKLRKLLGGQR